MEAVFAVLILLALILAWTSNSVSDLAALNLALIGALLVDAAWTFWAAFAVAIIVTLSSTLRLYLSTRQAWTR